MANGRITLNHNTPVSLTVRDHHTILARLNKHDRELTTLCNLLVIASEALPWVVEARELRANGYTYGEIAQRLDTTRDTVAAVLCSTEAA